MKLPLGPLMVKEMVKSEKAARKDQKQVFIVKSATRSGGLDYLHISLIILVIILIGLAFSLSRFSSVRLVNCQYGINNGTCSTASANSLQALRSAEKIIAGYSTVTTSLSLLPYYTLPSHYNASYIANSDKWLVYAPYTNPYTGNIISMYVLLNRNLTLNTSLMQTLPPSEVTDNYVVASGTISIKNKSLSTTNTPIPVNLIIDPYVSGAMSAIKFAVNTSKKYSKNITMEYDFIFTNAASSKYSGYGKAETQQLANYLFCASKHANFYNFTNNLSKIFVGNPLTHSRLAGIINQSGMNYTQILDCVATSSKQMYYQSVFAEFYKVTTTPLFIVNGKYETIPTKLNEAINYSLDTLK